LEQAAAVGAFEIGALAKPPTKVVAPGEDAKLPPLEPPTGYP
jgi:hypothetical protein